MPSYSLRDLAKEDMIDIYLRGFEEWGTEQADKFQEKLISVFHLLSENPGLGRPVEIRPHLQQHEVKPYIIFYQQVPDGVDIVRVIYENRLPVLHI